MMDDLPPGLIIDILNRLDDSADVARCRVAWKTFNLLSGEVRFINLRCSNDLFLKYRSPLKESSLTPFKTIFKTLICQLRIVESVSITVDRLPRIWLACSDELRSRKDDFYMTNVKFLKEWLPGVCDGLTTLSISDCWSQSAFAKSHMLSLVSYSCHNLIELEITKTKLSVCGLRPMPKLSKLTFKEITLEDKELKKVNECFFAVQVVNFIEISGLRRPKIHMMHLKSCHLSLYNAAYSVTIVAPSLVKMKLQCERPKTLVIEAPSLTELYLCLEGSKKFKVQDDEFVNLTRLSLESSVLYGLLCSLPFGGRKIKDLTLGSIKPVKPIRVAKFGFELLFRNFPNVSRLTLTPWAWSEMEMYVYPEDVQVRNEMKGLKQISAYLEIHDDFETTLSFIFYILDNCCNLTDMKLFILIHNDDVDTRGTTHLLASRCMSRCPWVRWRWGTWKGTKDAWIPDDICLSMGEMEMGNVERNQRCLDS